MSLLLYHLKLSHFFSSRFVTRGVSIQLGTSVSMKINFTLMWICLNLFLLILTPQLPTLIPSVSQVTDTSVLNGLENQIYYLLLPYWLTGIYCIIDFAQWGYGIGGGRPSRADWRYRPY